MKCNGYTDKRRQTQTDTDGHRQTQTGTDRYRQTQTQIDTGKHRQSQIEIEREDGKIPQAPLAQWLERWSYEP